MRKRILITGSRDWTNALAVELALSPLATVTPIIVVHGACPTGADKMADDWAIGNGVPVERYPALVDHYGKVAGPIRNQRMVDSLPDLCLAFVAPGSRGAEDCIKKAADAGIPVIRFTDKPE